VGHARRRHGKFYFPEGVAVDGSDYVYVADRFNHCIQMFTGGGTWLTQRGAEGAGTGQFDGPVGVTVDADGNVYVADTGNHRIQKWARRR
jgi:tripartite motif-containing protein 71